MIVKYAMFFVLLCLLLPQPAQGQALESKAAKYMLPNGMQVILVEKHANPMIACMVYVNAGSKYETDANNGVTHFLEHLLFDGTETRSREDITEGIKAKGGYINAFTGKEVTCYMVLMPNEFIETGLSVQSDMLFNSVLPDSELPKERKIVIEEIKQSEDNVDYQVEKFFDSTAYQGTPFVRTVLGSEQVISRIPKEEILDYYHTYYEPNNMVALVIGDFDTEGMKRLVEKYYGALPEKPLPPFTEIEFSPPAGREVKHKKVNSQNTYVNLCLNAPRYDHPDYYAFDMLTEILNLGETSPLTQALKEVPDPLATDVSAHLETQKEFSTLNLSIVTDSPAKVDRVLDATVKVLQDLALTPPEQKRIQGVIVSSKTHRYYQEEKLHFYGMMVAPVVVTCGWDFWENYIDNLEKVTPEKVLAVAKEYFSDPRYIATVVKPIEE
ncbi:MAG: pitrilysin family protein [Candidatus Zixiibacteriota bacterium]